MEPISSAVSMSTEQPPVEDQSLASYMGYFLKPALLTLGLYAGYYLVSSTCPSRSVITRRVERLCDFFTASEFQRDLKALKHGELSPEKFTATEAFKIKAALGYANAFRAISPKPYEFGMDVLCQLFPKMLASNLSDVFFTDVSTGPVAKDAPLNFIWVGSKLPEKYVSVPVNMAKTNQDKEVILWYFSPCLSEEEVSDMQNLTKQPLYQEAIDQGCKIRVLDLADIDGDTMPDSFQVDLNGLLLRLYENTGHKPSSSLLAADVARHFLMAAGSDVIDQAVAKKGGEPLTKSSTGMIYMDLDVPDGLTLSGRGNELDRSKQKVFKMSGSPLSDWLNQRLPLGMCMFHTVGRVDQGFLAVNQKWNPVFLKTLKQEAEAEEFKGQLYMKENLESLVSKHTFGALMEALTDALHPMETNPSNTCYSGLNVYFAAFKTERFDNDNTVRFQ